MNKVEKIKAYLEDRRKKLEDIKNRNEWTTAELGDLSCCKQTLSFIDSLEEEPVSKDLEEAAHSYVDTTIEGFDPEGNPCCYPAFIADAQWQKQQDPLTVELEEDHAYLACQEKIIEKACEWLKEHWREYVWLTDNDVIHFGHWQNDFRKAMEK